MRRQVEVRPSDDIDELLAELVRDTLDTSAPLRILDAGCGRQWTWDLGETKFLLTGIDTDADALALRVKERADLDEWIVGDLRTVSMPADSFDVVHSAYVLEHIAGARIVLDRLLAALRPSGIMVIKVPDRDSMYGFITRYTPHRLHVAYKRVVRRRPLAGTPGHGPYRVVYDRVISYDGLTGWAAENHLEILAAYGQNAHLDFFGRRARYVDAGLHAGALLSLGHLTAEYANIVVAFRKPATLPSMPHPWVNWADA